MQFAPWAPKWPQSSRGFVCPSQYCRTSAGTASTSWCSGSRQPASRYGTPQHRLSSNTMAQITSDCGAMRLPEHQMALIASGCVRQTSLGSMFGSARILQAIARDNLIPGGNVLNHFFKVRALSLPPCPALPPPLCPCRPPCPCSSLPSFCALHRFAGAGAVSRLTVAALAADGCRCLSDAALRPTVRPAPLIATCTGRDQKGRRAAPCRLSDLLDRRVRARPKR